MTYLSTVCRFSGLFGSFLIFLFCCQGDAAAVVQILHELKESQFIEEDL